MVNVLESEVVFYKKKRLHAFDLQKEKRILVLVGDLHALFVGATLLIYAKSLALFRFIKKKKTF